MKTKIDKKKFWFILKSTGFHFKRAERIYHKLTWHEKQYDFNEFEVFKAFVKKQNNISKIIDVDCLRAGDYDFDEFGNLMLMQDKMIIGCYNKFLKLELFYWVDLFSGVYDVEADAPHILCEGPME